MRTLEENKKIANKIIRKFNYKTFFDGVRVLMLMRRNKDGGASHNPDRKAVRIITNGIDEFKKQLEFLIGFIDEGQRIYMSVNERDMDKAIRQFKEMSLAVDYDSKEIRDKFYLDIHNRFLSASMKPSSSKTSYFLIDIDNEEEFNYFIDFLPRNKIAILERLATPNGEHFITDPFNPNLVDEKYRDCIKKDAMVLLYWL